MKRVVVGTAGHIDHGKTSLVRALTGIDTDRLREEKRRGITIELGFAHLALPDGTVVGVVDVPGHERFVRAMAAGAGGIDIVVLVVAADEGVMPQTREHLDICRLLGVPRGLVAITKSDLLSDLGPGWLPLLEQDVRAAAKGTFLDGCAVVPVSASTGEGLDRLVSEIARLAAEVPGRPADGPLFLPIDRAFSMKGFGTVVTGTLLSGQLAEGDEAALLPPSPGIGALRVRSVQVHGAATPRALAGQRTAVNLPGVEAASIRRGQALVQAGAIPSSILDAEVTLLSAAPRRLRNRARLLLHVGTAQVPATIALIDRAELAPGDTALAQLRLAEPIAALAGQRFILRGFTVLEGRGKTVGGGRVLGVAAPKRRTGRSEALASLQALASGDLDVRVAAVLEMAGPAGLEVPSLASRAAISPKAAQGALERLGSRGGALMFDRDRHAWVAGGTARELSGRLAAALDGFHAHNPLAAGIGREQLRGSLPPVVDARLFQRLLAGMAERGELAIEGEHVRRVGHSAAAPDAAGGALKERLALALANGGLAPPWLAELPALVGASPRDVQAVLKLLAAEDRAVRVSAELWFDSAAVAALREKLVAFLRDRSSITTQEFKELVGATRKHVIPLAEHFDREKVTLRVGEKRVLRKECRT